MNQYDIGLFMGKFAPLHSGHKWMIEECYKRCNTLIVLLSYDSRWIEKQPKELRKYISLGSRVHRLFSFVDEFNRKVERRVLYTVVDESHIPYYPDGWKQFCELCSRTIHDEFSLAVDCIFSSEVAYSGKYEMYWPYKVDHVIIDPERRNNSISSTKIRETIMKSLTGIYS